ncbi:hypothetical protein Tco_1267957 [Tanacetum coccineum]
MKGQMTQGKTRNHIPEILGNLAQNSEKNRAFGRGYILHDTWDKYGEVSTARKDERRPEKSSSCIKKFENLEDDISRHYKYNALNSVLGILLQEMDDPNIIMEEYIRLEEEKARRRGKVYNWETATYGKIWCDEDVHDLRSVETEFPAIFYNDALTSEVALSCEPTVSPLNNNQIDFRISFD